MTKLFKTLTASLLVCVILLGTGGFSFSSTVAAKETPAWSQSIIDLAVGKQRTSMSTPLDFSWSIKLDIAEAIYILALMSYYNPELKSSSGKTVSDRLVEHIKHITTGGNEPSCRGAIGAWIDNPIAQALVLAKNTPAVWNKLSSSERERCDFIMQCMAVSVNYLQNIQNNPTRDLSQSYEYHKGWGANMTEGNIDMMAAIYIYFGGADAVNAILANFDYDSYIAKMNSYGFSSMKTYFQLTGKKLLETGGTDAGGGSMKGARVPFLYRDVVTGETVPFEPYALFRSVARRLYCHTVTSRIKVENVTDKYGTQVYAYIGPPPDLSKPTNSSTYTGKTSPYEGMTGMCIEFISYDAHGRRTDAGYTDLSLRNTIPTRATLEALGYWKGDDINELESRMYVGTDDFFFKVDLLRGGGYYGYQKGNISWRTEADFYGRGYMFYKEIWNKTFGQRDFAASCKLSKNANKVTAKVNAYNLSLNQDRNMVVIAAVYDDSNRLMSIETQNVSVKSLTQSREVYKKDINLADTKHKVKLFIWDSLAGMRPLVDSAEI